MTRRVGICPVCETKQRVWWRHSTSEHVVSHHDSEPRHWGKLTNVCAGAGQKPQDTAEQKRRSKQMLDLIEPFRVYAAIALDAWVERHAYPQIDIDILTSIACRSYAIRHNMQHQHVGCVRAVARFTNREAKRYDLYCQFCGDLLCLNVLAPNETAAKFSRPNRHPVECALKHLAFSLQPAAPTVRKLPDEYVQESAS